MAQPQRRTTILGPDGQPVPQRSQSRATNYYGLNSGGIVNQTSGLGTSLDKSEASFFTPTRVYHRTPLEILCVQSWAARNMVHIPVIDSFLRWRSFMEEDEALPGTAEPQDMDNIEQEWNLTEKLARLMIAARQYGTGLMVFFSQEAPMDEPLVPEQIRSGDLKSIRVFDRHDASGVSWNRDLWDKDNYGKPDVYTLHPHRGGTPVHVHHSRIIRLEGINASSDSGLTTYEQDWGVSILVPIVLSILEDQTLASAISHLSQEASVPVLGVSDLRETLAGHSGTHEMTADQIGQDINTLKSNWRLLMLDKDTEEFTRVPVQFGGLSDLMDKFALRVAAAGQIPATRFLSRSPGGLNTTGEGDERNYIRMIEAQRGQQLDPCLPTIDTLLARNAGFQAAPAYEWHSLLELSQMEQTEEAERRVNTVEKAIMAGLIDEDEGRETIRRVEMFDHLEGDAPELPEPEPTEPPPTPGE